MWERERARIHIYKLHMWFWCGTSFILFVQPFHFFIHWNLYLGLSESMDILSHLHLLVVARNETLICRGKDIEFWRPGLGLNQKSSQGPKKISFPTKAGQLCPSQGSGWERMGVWHMGWGHLDWCSCNLKFLYFSRHSEPEWEHHSFLLRLRLNSFHEDDTEGSPSKDMLGLPGKEWDGILEGTAEPSQERGHGIIFWLFWIKELAKQNTHLDQRELIDMRTFYYFLKLPRKGLRRWYKHTPKTSPRSMAKVMAH